MGKYTNHDEIITALTSKVRQEESYREDAAALDVLEIQYEKKVFTAPLIGCGAGLILISSSIGTGKLASEYIPTIIPSLWMFFIGIIFSVASGLLYLFYIILTAEEKRRRGNAQYMVLNIRDRIWLEAEKADGSDFAYAPSEGDVILFDKIIKAHEGISQLSKWAKYYIFTARGLIAGSALMFIFGVGVPLFLVSSQFSFMWQ